MHSLGQHAKLVRDVRSQGNAAIGLLRARLCSPRTLSLLRVLDGQNRHSGLARTAPRLRSGFCSRRVESVQMPIMPLLQALLTALPCLEHLPTASLGEAKPTCCPPLLSVLLSARTNQTDMPHNHTPAIVGPMDGQRHIKSHLHGEVGGAGVMTSPRGQAAHSWRRCHRVIDTCPNHEQKAPVRGTPGGGGRGSARRRLSLQLLHK